MTLDELNDPIGIPAMLFDSAYAKRLRAELAKYIAVARAAQKAVESDSDRDFYALREALKELP